MSAAPQVLLMKESYDKDTKRKVQLTNISAAKAVADVVRTCLGPKAMLKMLLDPMGTIVMTNDGNAILREIHVEHPAAKSMIEISRAQDEEVGDGTTSVVVLAGELLHMAEPLLAQQIHPLQIINGYRMAMEDALEFLQKKLAIPINATLDDQVKSVIQSCLATKISHQWSDLVSSLAIDAVNTVYVEKCGKKEIDIKRYIRIEKIPGLPLESSQVLKGVVLNKDVAHTGMRRKIIRPRILLLDCDLDYKKGESMTNVELMKEEDFNRILEIEEETIKAICQRIIAHKPDLVFTEKGCSDIAQYYLQKAGISVIRRIKKTDNNRLSRAVGASVLNRTEDITPEAIGTGAGLFEIKKIGDEYYTFILDCDNPKACSILLHGPSKDVVNEIERNLHDALHVARNVKLDPFVVYGCGAPEMAISLELEEKSKSLTNVLRWPYQAAAKAFEVIPRTLIQNSGANPIRMMTELRAKLVSSPNSTFGINGENGSVEDISKLGIFDCVPVRTQVIKVAFEVTMMLLKIDEIVSGAKKQGDDQKSMNAKPTEESMKD